MNKKVFISIIIIILILLIISIILIWNLNLIKLNDAILSDSEEEMEKGDSLMDNYSNPESETLDRQAYFDVKNCVNDYYSILAIDRNSNYGIDTDGNSSRIADDSEIKNQIIGVLSTKFIKKNNITEENLFNKIVTYDKEIKFIPIEIKSLNEEKIANFIVHGYIFDKKSFDYIDDVFLIVNIDIGKGIYSIEPLSGEYTDISQISINEFENKIEDNIFNRFYETAITYTTEAMDYIDIYITLAIGKTEKLYDLLDKDYKTLRFGTLDNFKKYVNKNKNEIKDITASSYLLNNYDNYYEHVIKDQYGNLYIIKENNRNKLDYTVKLDTYTLDNDKFNKTYKTATNKDKVLMNLDKFFQMLNANDYKSSYAVLDDNFKATYFQTEESFENFVKQYMYPHANTKFMNFSDKISGVFTYYVELTNKANENDKEIGMNVVMQLKEGTDFRISFEIVR